MLARLLPQGDYSLVAHELARMGQQTPEALLGESDRRLVCKFLAVPHAAASIFIDWLHHQGPGYWGYSSDERATTRLILGDQVCDLGQRTYIMGILNVTPDSFSDGGLYLQPEQAIKHAETNTIEAFIFISHPPQSGEPQRWRERRDTTHSSLTQHFPFAEWREPVVQNDT